MNFIYFYRYPNHGGKMKVMVITSFVIKISLNVSKRILVTQATSDNSTENVHTDLFSSCDLKILRILSWCLVWWMNEESMSLCWKRKYQLIWNTVSLYQVPPECQIMQLQPPNVYFLISVPNTTPSLFALPQTWEGRRTSSSSRRQSCSTPCSTRRRSSWPACWNPARQGRA